MNSKKIILLLLIVVSCMNEYSNGMEIIRNFIRTDDLYPVAVITGSSIVFSTVLPYCVLQTKKFRGIPSNEILSNSLLAGLVCGLTTNLILGLDPIPSMHMLNYKSLSFALFISYSCASFMVNKKKKKYPHYKTQMISDGLDDFSVEQSIWLTNSDKDKNEKQENKINKLNKKNLALINKVNLSTVLFMAFVVKFLK